MTEIEQKALALVNKIAGRDFLHPRDMEDKCWLLQSICRAIEHHEAFKREVSDKAAEAISIAMKAGYACERGPAISAILSSFILPKPDPLVEVVKACGYATLDAIEPEFVADLNSTAERFGYRLKLERIEHE